MKTIMLTILILIIGIVTTSCNNSAKINGEFESLAGAYIEEYLQLYPESATSLGDHRYDGKLNDRSAEGVKRALEMNKRYLALLENMDSEKLSQVNRIDYQILKHQIERSIFSLEVVREYEWNPMSYNPGGAIYRLIARDFAPLPERMKSVEARLVRIPQMLESAKVNLKNPTKIHTETAISQMKGTISLIDNQLDEFIEQVPDQKQGLDDARSVAIAAIEDYIAWMEKDILPNASGDFRIGEEKFREKLRYTLNTDITMEEILKRAESDLFKTQNEMFNTALLISFALDPEGNPLTIFQDQNGPRFEQMVVNPNLTTRPERMAYVKKVIEGLANDHPNDETIVDYAKQCLEETRNFVIEKDFVTVPEEPIEIIVMPEFQRGVASAYCDSPGPLEPNMKTFFAISPSPKDWTPEQVESAYREDNNYMLHDLTIHEAMPGHYVQSAHANKFKAPTMVRSIFGSGTFVEGWATYAEQVMAEFGYGGPEVKMQMLKMHLRVIINAIIDQKIHAGSMTEEEAMKMMIDEGFQEEGEAKGKWRRACLTSTQLSTYFVGNLEMNDIRRDYEAKMGDAFDIKEYHDKVLSFRTPPPRLLRELMGL